MAKRFQVRDFDGIDPGLMHPEKADVFDNKRALEKLVDMFNQRFGKATILAAADDVVVSLGSDYAGSAVVATLNTVDGTLLNVRSAVIDAAGDLTITGNANATADTEVSYLVQG